MINLHSLLILDELNLKVEEELVDALAQLEDVSKGRNEAESIKNQVLREKSSYQMQLEETEEQLAEVRIRSKQISAVEFHDTLYIPISRFPVCMISGDEKIQSCCRTIIR